MIGRALPVYQGYASQYGHGLGNILGGVMRQALPWIGKIAKEVGTKLLESGVNYASKRISKRKAAELEQRRQKTKRVKRPASRPRIAHKRKVPPGQPIRTTKRKKGGNDIFS